VSPQYMRTFDSIIPLTEASTDGTTVTLRFDAGSAPSIWMQVLQGEGIRAFAVDTGLPVGTPEANPVATPEALTGQATPLTEMLAVLPAPLSITEGGTLPGWTYADIDQRFEDLGLTDEQLAEDPRLPLATNAYAPLVRNI